MIPKNIMKIVIMFYPYLPIIFTEDESIMIPFMVKKSLFGKYWMSWKSGGRKRRRRGSVRLNGGKDGPDSLPFSREGPVGSQRLPHNKSS